MYPKVIQPIEKYIGQDNPKRHIIFHILVFTISPNHTMRPASFRSTIPTVLSARTSYLRPFSDVFPDPQEGECMYLVEDFFDLLERERELCCLENRK